jgi:hypothetical protein
MKLSWTSAVNNGSAVTAYTVTTYGNGGFVRSTTFDAATTTRTISGLSNGSSYTFAVVASNARGSGPPSALTNPVTAGAPTAPTSVTATSAAAGATVRWTAPSASNGASVTGYVITPFLGIAAQAPRNYNSTATTQAVTGLRSGASYTFSVAAINANGTGPQSAPSNTVTPT